MLVLRYDEPSLELLQLLLPLQCYRLIIQQIRLVLNMIELVLRKIVSLPLLVVELLDVV